MFVQMMNSNTNHVSEITEEEEEELDEYSSDLFGASHGVSMASIREECGSTSSMHEDCVYIAVGKGDSSVDALSWTLRNAVNPASTTVYLVHVFPETHLIPSPLGKLPKNQVSPEMVDNYMAQQRGERREFLQKFINMCSTSKVKVDTMLVESDMVAKAILDLIPILNMRKLVVGTPRSNLRKIKSGKGTGIADQLLLENEMESCEIKIICQGNEVVVDRTIHDEQLLQSSTSTKDDDSNGSTGAQSNKPMEQKNKEDNNNNDSISCLCFKTKF